MSYIGERRHCREFTASGPSHGPSDLPQAMHDSALLAHTFTQSEDAEMTKRLARHTDFAGNLERDPGSIIKKTIQEPRHNA
jgi:hypothetical protein